MNRLQFYSQSIKNQGKIPKFVDSSFDFLNLSSLLTPQENAIRLKVRKFIDNEVRQSIIPCVQQAKFPYHLVPKLRELDISRHFYKKPYGFESSQLLQGVIYAELARGDAGLSTFFAVDHGLLGYTIETLGSEEQKKKYLPKIINYEMIGGWGLTEDKIGSDASNLVTKVTKNGDKYIINGVKRWIGNGNMDLIVIWARNTQTKNVQGYILETTNPLQGYKSEVMKNKLALRVVQNCDITLNNVQVSLSQKLPLATDFQNGTNKILTHSRLSVAWFGAGVCMGVYDNVIKYVSSRNQFGRPISGFQLIQQKIVRIMANIQGMLLLCMRLATMVDQGIARLSQISMAKAWISQRGRQVCRLGRQICGGNGLLHENYVMRALADMEAIYTYEGSYQVNVLVAGRQITGLAAFVK